MFRYDKAPQQIHIGSVGWEDEEDWYFVGTANDDGHTLVRVQLFSGRNHATELSPTRAQGHKLICHLPNGVFRIPPKDARCYVAIPAGMELLPAAGVIIASVGGGHERFTNLNEKATVVQATDGEARVVVRDDGSIAIFTTSSNDREGGSVYLRVAPDGLSFVSPWGTLKYDDTGFHILHSSGASFDLGGIFGMPSPLDEIASYVKMQAATVNVVASAQSLGVGTVAPLTSATAAATALSNLQTQLTAVMAAVAAIQADPLHSASVAATAAAAAAVTAGATALTATALLLPTSTSSS